MYMSPSLEDYLQSLFDNNENEHKNKKRNPVFL